MSQPQQSGRQININFAAQSRLGGVKSSNRIYDITANVISVGLASLRVEIEDYDRASISTDLENALQTAMFTIDLYVGPSVRRKTIDGDKLKISALSTSLTTFPICRAQSADIENLTAKSAPANRQASGSLSDTYAYAALHKVMIAPDPATLYSNIDGSTTFDGTVFYIPPEKNTAPEEKAAMAAVPEKTKVKIISALEPDQIVHSARAGMALEFPSLSFTKNDEGILARDERAAADIEGTKAYNARVFSLGLPSF